MSTKQRLLFITTGGTIASVRTQQGLKPVLTSEELLAHLPELNELCCPDTLALCSIDSTDLGPEHWLMMAKAVQENYALYDGFIICHGTDTLAYSAAALSYLIQNADKPVILTGAQQPISNEITDAKKNLRDSVICALDPGTRAKKNKTISYDAFASVNFPALALVQGDRLVRYVPSPWPTGPVEFGRSLSPRVFLLKLTPGLSPDLIPDIFRLYDCVIVESFGVGGIPQRLMDAFAEGLGDYDKTHKVLILTTQVTYEGSDVGIYEVGKRVKNRFRFLEAHDMTTASTSCSNGSTGRSILIRSTIEERVMKNEREKALFLAQLKDFANTLSDKIAVNDEWTIKGFIDIFKNIYTISSDTKIVSKILELHLFPQFLAFAEQTGYDIELATYQNYYPDLTFISKIDPSIKFAVDLKTTYREENHPDFCNGFTLGSHGEYFINRTSTKNIQYPYDDYSGHFCFGIIYTRAVLDKKNETHTYSIDELNEIPSVIHDFLFFAEEKWKIASDKGGSGNTANIGSIHNIQDILNGNGVFAKAGEELFDDYWANFGKIEILSANKRKKLSSFSEYLQYRGLPSELNNCRASKRSTK